MFASGIIHELLAEATLIIAPNVAEELLYVYVDDARQKRQLIDSTLFEKWGLVSQVADLTVIEQERFVIYAQHVDDGEAQSLAIAKERGLTFLTDDIAAFKLAKRELADLQTSLGLVRLWSAAKSSSEITVVLKNIRDRARYRPPTDHLDYTWYSELMAHHL